MSLGGTPASDVSLRIFELLEDGEWKEWEHVVREAGKVIPPGQAVRRAERQRQNTYTQRGVEVGERKRPVSDERAVQIGRRAYVRESIHTSRSRGHIDIRLDDEGVRWVRMLSFPPAVAIARARARATAHFHPSDLADELRGGADINALLAELSHNQLLDLAKELARRERARGLSSASQPTIEE